MKKYFGLILAVILVLLAGCSAAEEEVYELSYDTETGEVDMNGYQCRILQGKGIGTGENIFKYPVQTEIADDLLERFSELEAKYNCVITLKEDSGSDYLQSFTNNILCGEVVGEIGECHCPGFNAKSGILLSLDGIDTIDYTDTKKYGAPNLNLIGMYKGERYTVSPVEWAGKQMTYAYNVFAVSGNNITKYGLTDPRDYYENGTWTWDTFEKSLVDYTIVDGEKKIPAVNFTWRMIESVMYANGVHLVEKNEQGEYISGLQGPAMEASIDWVRTITSTYRDNITYLGHYDMVDAFINDKLVLAQSSFSHMINEIIFNVDNYGCIPFPCGPTGEYGKNSGAVSGFDAFFVFINAYEPDAAGIIISELFEPFRGYEGKEGLKKYARTIWYDERDVDWFITHIEYCTSDYFVCDMTGTFSSMDSDARSGKGPAEILQKYSSIIDSKMQEYIIPNQMAIDRVFGTGS